MEAPCAHTIRAHAPRAGTWNGVPVAITIVPSQELQI